jgi:hypothetical protein
LENRARSRPPCRITADRCPPKQSDSQIFAAGSSAIRIACVKSCSSNGLWKFREYSVGVARQYCGQLGKQDNCQVAVTLSIANHDARPVAYRLYLPKDWASDRGRRRKVGIPDEIIFKTICSSSL